MWIYIYLYRNDILSLYLVYCILRIYLDRDISVAIYVHLQIFCLYRDPYKGHCEYQTSFVGFAPARHPRFVALVMIDSPQSKNPYDIEGGYVAAPAFKSIAQGILQVLQIKSDRPKQLH